MTCAEGGAVMTNRRELYTRFDGYSDHGHDHKGVDRGADLHPFIGYNYRISELHAAVGLAQIRKLDKVLSIQRKNHAALKAALEEIPGISFRRIPDPAGDSCTFLSWFLPSDEEARAVIAELKTKNILAGNFYWFDNNWHYIRKWDHLKNAASLNNLHPDHSRAVREQANKDFSASDEVMRRCISTLINLSWTDEQVKEKAKGIAAAVKKVLSGQIA
jgi:8-amino-3,8-dideoxy-alpha-D-manno-octulosonate transaminase